MQSPLLFWILATLIITVTLIVLLVALLRRRDPTSDTDGTAASIALFRDQRSQLDDDLASGTLAAGERDAQVRELATRLGHEVDAPSPPPAAPSRAPWIAALLVVASVPLVSAALYLVLGDPAAIAPPPAASAAPKMDREQVEAMVASLAQKMKANPADPRGWQLLGRSYAAMGRFDDAARAYGEAAQRAPDDAGTYADWADTLAMAQGQSLAGKPTELIAKALAIDPTHPKALALAGAAAMDRHDPVAALGYWRTLLPRLAPGSDEAREVAAAIAQLERDQGAGIAGTGTGARVSAGSAPASAGSGAPASTSPAGAGTARPNVASKGAATTALSGRVELAPALAARAASTDAVFIFARAVNGPRMPLAVLRTTVADLPRAFTLDDSMAMAPGMQLSSFPEVMVEVRVSKSGSATPASGDLTGQAGPFKTSTVNIRLVIDHLNP